MRHHLLILAMVGSLLASVAWDRWECRKAGGCYRVTGDQMKVMVRQVADMSFDACRR